VKLLDSSFILSLSKIRALHLLRLGDQPYYTIPEVFEEIVTKGIAVGYPDAIIIKEELFDKNIVKICQYSERLTITGVSTTDSKILRAAESSNTILFADDKTLVKKAGQLGIKVEKSPDFLKNRYQEGDMPFATFRESINSLVSEKRLSRLEAEKILEENKDAKKSKD
jgi:hypothetical protein